MRDKNPLKFVSFYRVEGERAYLVTKDLEEISFMMPERVQATTIRCFVKQDHLFETAKHAFKQFCKDKLGGDCAGERGVSHSMSQRFS